MINIKQIGNIVLICIGSIFMIIGVIGIFIPLLPTTPFLLLASACFIRGSEKCHNLFLNNKLFGKYIKNYLDKKGITLQAKIYTIIMLWVSILISSIFAVSILWVRIILILIAIIVTTHLLMIRTLSE